MGDLFLAGAPAIGRVEDLRLGGAEIGRRKELRAFGVGIVGSCGGGNGGHGGGSSLARCFIRSV